MRPSKGGSITIDTPMRARPFEPYSASLTRAFGGISPIEGKAGGSGGSSTRTDASMPWGSPTLAAGGFDTPAHLRMLCEEGCRTAVLGKTERTVGWEGDGDPIMTGLVRHCKGKPAATDRPRLPSLSHSFTLDWLLGISGPRAEAEAIKGQRKAFLCDT